MLFAFLEHIYCPINFWGNRISVFFWGRILIPVIFPHKLDLIAIIK